MKYLEDMFIIFMNPQNSLDNRQIAGIQIKNVLYSDVYLLFFKDFI